MKKHTPLLLILSAFALVSCGTVNPASSAVSSATPTSSAASSSITEVDYAHNGSVALSLDYAGHDFYKDGIGQVSLHTCIDGDTAHFDPLVTTTSGLTIKSRFWGIDTPESTGQIQPYGKQASNFTKEKLTAAATNGTIVVSSPFSTYQVPEKDSTGTRYVSLVWINTEKKNAPYKELTLLNLWIVQEGLSNVKNVSDIPSYSDTFYAAEKQAETLKLKMFSGEPDPLFNYGEYQDVSLLELKNEVLAKMADSTHVNKYDGWKVRVTGTVAGYVNNVLYIESYFDSSTGSTKAGGEYAGINIFCGMTTIPSKFTKLNTYIQVSGVASDSDLFGFQISGATFPRISSDAAGEAEVLIAAADNTEEYALKTFDYKVSSAASGDYAVLSEGDNDALNCALSIHGNLYCSGGYDSTDGDTRTLYLKDTDANGASTFFTVYIPFTYKPDANDPNLIYDTYTKFVGHTFNLSGIFGYHKTSSGRIAYQMTPRNSADLVQVA